MAEQIDLTTPVSKPSTINYHVERLTLDWDAGSLTIQLKGNNGEALAVSYGPTSTPTGVSLMTSLNKINLSTRSLNQRIFDRLVLDGIVLGAVTGSVP